MPVYFKRKTKLFAVQLENLHTAQKTGFDCIDMKITSLYGANPEANI